MNDFASIDYAFRPNAEGTGSDLHATLTSHGGRKTELVIPRERVLEELGEAAQGASADKIDGLIRVFLTAEAMDHAQRASEA